MATKFMPAAQGQRTHSARSNIRPLTGWQVKADCYDTGFLDNLSDPEIAGVLSPNNIYIILIIHQTKSTQRAMLVFLEFLRLINAAGIKEMFIITKVS